MGDMGVQMSKISDADPEIGKRLIELEETLAILREENTELKITENQLNEKIKELRDQNVRLYH
jgi:cell division protein FtsB